MTASSFKNILGAVTHSDGREVHLNAPPPLPPLGGTEPQAFPVWVKADLRVAKQLGVYGRDLSVSGRA